MPVVLTLAFGRVKVSVYFKDHNPPHVHVRAGDANAVFDLRTLAVMEAYGFTRGALTRMQRELEQHRVYLMNKWREYQDG